MTNKGSYKLYKAVLDHCCAYLDSSSFDAVVACRERYEKAYEREQRRILVELEKRRASFRGSRHLLKAVWRLQDYVYEQTLHQAYVLGEGGLVVRNKREPKAVQDTNRILKAVHKRLETAGSLEALREKGE